jgi:hypothetical protein
MYRFTDDTTAETGPRLAVALLIWAAADAVALGALQAWGSVAYVAVGALVGWPMFYAGLWFYLGEPPHRVFGST